MSRPEPRKWRPKNPQKYKGDPTNIWARSSWEVRFFNWCDSNLAIIEWSSEELIIPYRCGTDNRIHRYFPDAVIKYVDRNGKTVTCVVEIKPDVQTRPPVVGKRRTQKYLQESLTFVKNQSKWKAARAYCADRGYEFKILTEYDLGIAKRKQS